MRSKILAAAAAAMIGTAALAAAPAHSATPVTVTIWTFGNVIEPQAIADYKKLHPEVTLSIKKSAMDQNHQNLVVAFQARQTPDIAAIEISYSGLFRSYPKYFTNLNTLGASKIKGNYLPWRWDQGTGVDGSVIGIPTDVGGLQVAYRRDLFAKAGLPTDRTKVGALWPTWDKFISTGTAYQKKAKKPFIDSAGTIFTAILNQGTQKMYKPNGTPDPGNAQVKAAFTETAKALQAKIGARFAPYTGDWYAGMNKGDYAVVLAPAWQLDYIKQYAPGTRGKWDVAAVPGGGGNIGGSQLSIPAAAKHKKEAWDFISWYLSPAQQAKVFTKYGLFPSIPSLYRTAAIKNYRDPFFNNAPIGAMYSAAALKLKPIFEGNKERSLTMVFSQALSRIETGKQNPSAAWNSAIADANTLLKR